MSARKYTIVGTRAVASPTQTLLGLTGGTTFRVAVHEIFWGSSATPADNAIEWLLQRYTAAGTSSAVTPQALRGGDVASLATAGKNHTVEPTYTAGAILLDIPANQRSTPRWAAKDGFEIEVPAVSANGLGWQPVNSSFTGNVTSTIFYEE